MSKCPHLYRRGNVLYFRLSVPLRFRAFLRTSEITQSLHTQDRRTAIPAAHKLACEAKTLFLHLDKAISNMTNREDYSIEELEAVVNDLDREEKEIIASFPLLARKFIEQRDKEKAAILAKANERERLAGLKTKAEAFDKLQSLSLVVSSVNQQPVVVSAPSFAKKRSTAPRLSVIRERHINSLNGVTTAANTKITAAKWWDAFVDVVGDKSIADFEQTDVDTYLIEICYLPSQDTETKYSSQLKKLSYKDKIKFCKDRGLETISKKSFVNNYKSPLDKFLEFGYREYKTQGFKKIIVDKTNKYIGNQEAGKNEQRPLTVGEVDKLINNDEMRAYINDPNSVHFYWLVVLALFSGGRLNELCQLHPERDIRQDEKSGTWFFEVVESIEPVEAGAVTQFAKTEAAKREVAIHQKLIDLGFIDYVLRRISEGAEIIFPFQPRKKDGDILRAGDNAGQEFTKYLKKIGLYDNTPNNKVSGLHSLRKTFVTEAATCVEVMFPNEDDDLERFKLSLAKLAPIIGHETSVRTKTGENVAMPAFYAKRKMKELKKGDIAKKKTVIDLLDYGVEFPIPK